MYIKYPSIFIKKKKFLLSKFIDISNLIMIPIKILKKTIA